VEGRTMIQSDTSTRAAQAYDVHAALLRIEQAHPELRGNPFWIMLKQDAYERFHIAFEAQK